MLIEAMTIKLMTLALSAGTIQPPADQVPPPPHQAPHQAPPRAQPGQAGPDDREPPRPRAQRNRAPRENGPREGGPRDDARNGPMNDDQSRGMSRGGRGPDHDQADPGPRQPSRNERAMRPNAGPNAEPNNGPNAGPNSDQRRIRNRDVRRAGRAQGQMNRRPMGQRPGRDMQQLDPRGMRTPMPPQGRGGRGDVQPPRGPNMNRPHRMGMGQNDPRGYFRGQGVPMGRGPRTQDQRGPQRTPQDFRDGPRFFGPQQHRAPMPPMHDRAPRRRDR